MNSPLPLDVLQILTVWSRLPEARWPPRSTCASLLDTSAEKNNKHGWHGQAELHTSGWNVQNRHLSKLGEDMVPALSSGRLYSASSWGLGHQARAWISSSWPRRRWITSPFLLISISAIIPSLYLREKTDERQKLAGQRNAMFITMGTSEQTKSIRKHQSD